MKKIYTAIILLALINTFPAMGQVASRQAGFRAGYRWGLFYQVTGETGNAETGYSALLSFQNSGVQITGLRVIYLTSIPDISPNLFVSWGYGAHMGFIYTNHIGFFGEDYYFSHDRFCPLIGVDGWCSAEYRITDIPLVISLNIKPYVELTIPSFFKIVPFDVGLSLSYSF
jgi:hypothetical protein